MDLAGVADIGFTFGLVTSVYFLGGIEAHGRCQKSTEPLAAYGMLDPRAVCAGRLRLGLATVEGKVTVDGQPVGAGRVVFRSPDGKSTVIAKIATDGSYRALNVPRETMNVTVAGLTKFERIRLQRGVKGKRSSDSQALVAAIASSPTIPEKYQDPDASGLMFTATSGINTYNIELLSQ